MIKEKYLIYYIQNDEQRYVVSIEKRNNVGTIVKTSFQYIDALEFYTKEQAEAMKEYLTNIQHHLFKIMYVKTEMKEEDK